jgi:hypothetical protein
VLSQVNLPHAAFTERLEDAVPAGDEAANEGIV